MIKITELLSWAATLPKDGHVAVDEGGLTLRAYDGKKAEIAYIEVGGLPEPELPTEDPCGTGGGHEFHAEWQHDAQGIPLCRTCEACHDFRMSKYRPEILRGYTQADVDEPIEQEQ